MSYTLFGQCPLWTPQLVGKSIVLRVGHDMSITPTELYGDKQIRLFQYGKLGYELRYRVTSRTSVTLPRSLLRSRVAGVFYSVASEAGDDRGVKPLVETNDIKLLGFTLGDDTIREYLISIRGGRHAEKIK